MSQIDLYSLLRGYAVNTKTATVSIKYFLEFAAQYAAKKQSEQPELARWTINAETEFKREISALVDNGKCVLLSDSKDGSIFLPDFCREIIRAAYQNVDKHAAIPFLNAASLNLKIPADYARTVGLLSDIEAFFARTDTESAASSPDEIIILQFPQEYGSSPMLASMIPRRLMELALIKIQFFLNNGHNMAHIVNTLNIQIKNKEKALKECIDRIIYRPLECINDMERFDDFVYLFWVHFCALVKKDIKAKNEIRDLDIAILQSVYVIEVCGSLYRSAVVRKQEADAAYNRLEELMDLPPYRYSIGDIAQFTTDKGVRLLDYLSKQEMEAYVRRKITESKDGALPAWLSIQGAMGERWFLKKEHYLPVCAQMLNEIQPQIKTALVRRWTKLIRDYSSEPAMEKDPEYEKLLKKLTNNTNPILQTLLEDPKLLWAYEELERTLGTVPQNMRLFNRGILLPFYVLYALSRKEVISEIKSQLPIWYSNPILLAILKFFKRLGRKKSPQRQTEGDEKHAASGKKLNKLQSSALRIKSDIVPEGKTIDEHLGSLEERWCSLRDEDTRKTLIVGVKSLLKDRLRKNIKLKNVKWIKRDDLRSIAEYLISENSTLAKLKDQEALCTYMELYMLKLLLR
ncbi:MAG: hypothetical protein LBU85_13255 [Treponema sp.]|jgi:hypothetical protein|nr:hypothetical protein [Treponema sp.]